MNIPVKLISPHARMPRQASVSAAGYDLYASQDIKIPANSRGIVLTDIQIAIPVGCYGRIAPRSGLALKWGVDVGAGVIDPDYRGDIRILLFNFGERDFFVKAGDRVAQLIFEQIFTPILYQQNHISATERNVGSFGSTDNNMNANEGTAV